MTVSRRWLEERYNLKGKKNKNKNKSKINEKQKINADKITKKNFKKQKDKCNTECL